jgi:hypothetical protein
VASNRREYANLFIHRPRLGKQPSLENWRAETPATSANPTPTCANSSRLCTRAIRSSRLVLPAVALVARRRRFLQAHQSVFQRPEAGEQILNALFQSVNKLEYFDLLVPDDVQIPGNFSEGFHVFRHSSSKGQRRTHPIIIQPLPSEKDSAVAEPSAGQTADAEYIGPSGESLHSWAAPNRLIANTS